MSNLAYKGDMNGRHSERLHTSITDWDKLTLHSPAVRTERLHHHQGSAPTPNLNLLIKNTQSNSDCGASQTSSLDTSNTFVIKLKKKKVSKSKRRRFNT